MTKPLTVDDIIDSLSRETLPSQLEVEWQGIDLNAIGSHGRTPLMAAAQQGLLQVAETLVSCGASVQTAGSRQMTPLHEAAANGEARMVGYLLSQGAEIDAVTADGVTPLMCAAAWGSLDVVQILLKNGADPTKADRTGATASEIAREKGEDHSAELIESYGGAVD